MDINTEIEPQVSFLITVYNGLPYIKDALNAILQQEYSNIEIIIVDDGSNDGTSNYLKEVNRLNANIKLLTSNRIGRGRALNLGLEHCNGKYVAINDADDISLPERIKKQVHFLEANPDYVLVGSKMKLVNLDTGKVTNDNFKDRPIDDQSIRHHFLVGQPIQHSAALIRKSALEKLGGYNEKINFLYDRDIFMQLAGLGKLYNLDEPLIHLGRHTDQFFYHTYTGADRIKHDYHYRLRAVKLLGLPFWNKWPIWLKRQWSLTPEKYRKRIKSIIGKT